MDIPQVRRHDVFSLCLQKLSSINEENERFLVDLERLKQLIDDRITQEEELMQLRDQNRKMQDTLGEMQQSLLQEREQVLRLTTENTRFRFKELEGKRKMEDLAAKAGGSGSDKVTHVVDSRARLVVAQPKVKGNGSKAGSSSGTVIWSDVAKDDAERVRLLQRELEEQARLHRETVSAMEADRKLLIMERDAERLKDADEIRRISQRLRDLEMLFHEVMKDKLGRRQNFSVEVGNVLRETNQRPRGDRSVGHRQVEVEENLALEKRIKALERTAAEKEKEADQCRRESLAAEMMANDYREQVEAVKRSYDEKLDKCREKIDVLKKQYERLDSRRRLEASGFRNEICIMQDQLKKSEQLMLRIVSTQPMSSRTSSSPVSSAVARTPKHARSRSTVSTQASKALRSDIKKVKTNIAKLERMLNDV